MKSIKALAIVAATAACVGTAQADDSGAYINIGGETWEGDVVNIFARGGYMVSKNFGLELDGSIGITDEQGAKVDSSFAGYAVGKVPLGSNVNLLGRLGYHTTDLSLAGVGSGSVDGVAAGIGLEYFFSDTTGIRIDSTGKYVSEIDDAFGVLSLGLVQKF